jgi:excisionase family DNA binding protein
MTVPEAGRLLGIGRDAAYAAAARGEIPVLTLGRRLVVPTALLYELCGITPDSSEADPPRSAIAVNVNSAAKQEVGPHGKPLRLA